MIRKFPVAWLTTLVTTLVAVDTALEGLHVLSVTQATWAGGIIAVLTAILGAITHSQVTPLVAPKDSSGRSLVPASSAHR
jgi:hypothetical protein